MRMTLQENGVIGKVGQMILGIHMSMGRKNELTEFMEDVVVCRQGEPKDHLVDLGIAIAANSNDFVADGIHDFNDFLWRIVLRKVVSRTVVQDIAKAKNICRIMDFTRLHDEICAR